MHGHAASAAALSHEEKMALIEERSISDVESESGRMDLEGRFSNIHWTTTLRSYSKGLRLSSWTSILRRAGIFILPSFTHHRLQLHQSNKSRGTKLAPTAYLDGMRGLAALFVFFCHYFYTAFHIAEGWGRDGAHKQVWKLPFVRLLFSGPSMVCIFFVISGYALSLKPLKQIRGARAANGGGYDGFSRTMSSFAFRRFFRLYLPPMISTFGIVVLLRLGAFEKTRAFAADPTYIKNVLEPHPPLLETTREQLWHWAWEMFQFVHIFGFENHGGSTGYDVHLWTIPVEFRCSMVLFLTMLATARLRTPVRMGVVALFGWFILRNDRWEMLLFLAGMAIAELDLIRGAHEPSSSPSSSSSSSSSGSSATAPGLLLPRYEKMVWPAQRRFTAGAAWTVLAIPALYLMSAPDAGCQDTPGYAALLPYIPEYFSEKYRFWQMVGSIALVFTTARSPPLQRFFNTGVVQYFGRISYAIYLMHGPVQHTAGYAVERWVWTRTGVEGGWYNVGATAAACVNIPLVIWAADVFWRAVDAPVVRFTKALETRLSVED
ncbi:acyltransferase [Xylariaceae sp. FL0016]|nr:acyltransferase [Xylariaceae sp. FL0016]